MKKLIFLFSMALVMLSAGVHAQNIGGDFCCGTTHGAAPTYNTKLDTVTNTGKDTVYTPLNPYRNSVGFQVNVKKISGDPSSCIVHVWGSKAPSVDVHGSKVPVAGGFVEITTFSIANASGLQVFNCDVNNGIGNIYRNYMLTWQGVGTQVSSWQTLCFIR